MENRGFADMPQFARLGILLILAPLGFRVHKTLRNIIGALSAISKTESQKMESQKTKI